MSNINTFFDNAPLHNKIKQNENEEPDQNDVLIMDDIDDFGQSFSNLNDIKKLNSEKINENKEKSKQVIENILEREKKINPIVNRIENLREKSNTTKTIPIINSDNVNGKNVTSNIDNLFSNYKNSSLFNSNLNSITNHNLLNAKIEKEAKAAELEQKMNAVNLNEQKIFSISNNRSNQNNNNYGNQIHFERNAKLRNNAINSNNASSNKELINLLNKPVNNFENKQATNLNIFNANKYEQENINGFSNLNNINNIINNQNTNNNNTRYPDLNSRESGTNGTRKLDNNTSINMHSAKGKNLNAYNNNINQNTSTESYRSQIQNYNNNNNSLQINRISDSDQVNYDKFKTPTAQRQLHNNNTNNSNDNKINPEFHSVREYASREEMNPKYKNNMEDHVKIIDKFNENAKMGLFSLYDGHGGEDPVKYAKERIPEILAKFIKNSNDSIDNCLTAAFEKVDNELKFYDSENTGTTATVVVINGKQLFLANVGDSRCVLVTGAFELQNISYDHKCSDEFEIERIKKSGGMIFNNRVFGQLALTRALGDHAIKKYGVVSTPFVKRVEVKTGDFIVIASDGVWDVTSDEEIIGFIKKGGKCAEIVDCVVQHSLLKGSKDNISCVVVKI